MVTAVIRLLNFMVISISALFDLSDPNPTANTPEKNFKPWMDRGNPIHQMGELMFSP
jgi:hypothetical protein